MTINKNVLGGFAALLALAAIFLLSQRPPSAAPSRPMVHVVPAPAPAVVKPPVKPTPKPETKAEPKPAPKAPESKTTYYRVEHDGKQGAAIECASVQPFANGKSPAELAVLAKQYGVTESDLKRYLVCTN